MDVNGIRFHLQVLMAGFAQILVILLFLYLRLAIIFT
jgi:hypothetical protein